MDRFRSELGYDLLYLKPIAIVFQCYGIALLTGDNNCENTMFFSDIRKALYSLVICSGHALLKREKWATKDPVILHHGTRGCRN